MVTALESVYNLPSWLFWKDQNSLAMQILEFKKLLVMLIYWFTYSTIIGHTYFYELNHSKAEFSLEIYAYKKHYKNHRPLYKR